MYMLEANSGPGLGVLLAYWAFAKDKATKDSAPGAIIIHFFGGIHEIYFPYVLMNPVVIIAPIVGNMCAITWFLITGCGLKGPASPGSIIAFMAMAPKNKMLPIFVGVVIAAAVSFAIVSLIIKATSTTASIDEAKAEVADRKAQAKGAVKKTAISLVQYPEGVTSELRKHSLYLVSQESAMSISIFWPRLPDVWMILKYLKR